MVDQMKQVGQFVFDPSSKPLGAGTFGKVFRGTDFKNNDAPVAIKVIPPEILEEYKDFIDLFLREINILKEIRGDYILEFKKVLRTGSGNIYIVTNLCNGGNLEEAIAKRKSLPESEALRILRQCTEAFVSIESLDLKNEKKEKVIIMHRDIKPANILFHDGSVRIADFGFAKMVEDKAKEKKAQHTLLGTPYYMSPQILAETKYSYKCDIWSLGIVIYECLYGELPWKSGSKYGLLKSIEGKPMKDFDFKGVISKDFQDLLIKMLEKDEEKRIDWHGILAHPAIVKNKKEEEEQQQLKKEEKQKPDEVKTENKKPEESKQENADGSKNENEKQPSQQITQENNTKPQIEEQAPKKKKIVILDS